MTAFDKIVEDFAPELMHRDFRLWLSSMPSAHFPVAVLQVLAPPSHDQHARHDAITSSPVLSLPSRAPPPPPPQNGVKMTLEPPKGLKANVRRTYLAMDAGYMEASAKPREWRKLLFAIALFHALVQARPPL
jgi:dynein heavy chain